MVPLLTGSVKQTLDNTVGAIYLGVVGASFLFGVNTLQLGYYYHSFNHDIWLHKFAVALLWVLDALHSALTIHAVYVHVVTGFNDLDTLMRIQLSMQVQVAINIAVIIIVHCPYAHRIWKFGGYHRGILGYITMLLVAGASAIGILLAYKVFTIEDYTDLENIQWAVQAGLATSTVVDFFIALVMVYYLHKSLGQGHRLNTRISLAIQYVLGSGLLTSACSIAVLFSYVLRTDTFIFLGLGFLLTKLYVGSFLAMLNARERAAPPGTLESDTLTSTPTSKRRRISSYWSSEPLPAQLASLPTAHNRRAVS